MKRTVLGNVVLSVSKIMEPVPATQGLLDVNANVRTVSFQFCIFKIHDKK